MADSPAENPTRRILSFAVVASVLWAILFLLLFRMPPDGKEHGDLGEFFGRFHPLLVHGPVALLLVVPLMEFAALGRKRAHLAPAAGWLLAVAVVAAYGAAADGWLLAWSAGFRGRDVTRHMWGGLWLGVACTAALAVRSVRADALWARRAYPVLLAASLSLLLWTGHFGGALTHGDGFLTDKMPSALRSLLRLSPPPAALPDAHAPEQPAVHVKGAGGSASVDPASPYYYEVHVAPLFSRSCVSCHRPEKHKGGLRMDTLEQLMKGGADGAALVPGRPEISDLIRRVHLPSSDDDYMPSNGEKPLAPEEITMVERWIAAGAKGR